MCPSQQEIELLEQVEDVAFFVQGKEIVKIKQENKALRESSVSNGDSSSGREIFILIRLSLVPFWISPLSCFCCCSE